VNQKKFLKLKKKKKQLSTQMALFMKENSNKARSMARERLVIRTVLFTMAIGSTTLRKEKQFVNFLMEQYMKVRLKTISEMGLESIRIQMVVGIRVSGKMPKEMDLERRLQRRAKDIKVSIRKIKKME